METAEIAKVAVSAAPYSIDKPYDYLVPESLLETALPGVRVTVPFGRGNRTSEGVILARTCGEKVRGLKPLAAVLDAAPVLDGDGIALALWLRQRYFCTMFEAVKTILPAGLWYRLQERVSLGVSMEEARTRCADIPGADQLLDVLESLGGSAPKDTLESTGIPQATIRAMEHDGILLRQSDAKRQIGDKTRTMAELAISGEEALALTERKRSSAPVRYAVTQLLSTEGKTSAAELCYYTGATMRTLRAMEKAGLLKLTQEEALRIPTEETAAPGPKIIFSQEQQRAFNGILSLLESGRAEAALLYGVTGSGKTQIYIRLVQEALRMGKSAIVLVPEIVLTPQMMRKFRAYFGSEVAMLHSSLRMTERYDQWKRIRRGEVRVVLGTRSAIFAPVKNLGLIVLDEEQEGSYQSENPPRYHTRDVAKFLCARFGATLLLGSATPSVESAWAAENKTYHLFTLRQRYNARALPRVSIADLRDEVRRGNPGVIGGLLQKELEENLRRGEQSILFLNRRGNSRMLLCGECGYVPQCPRCSAALTYHSANGRLMCHHCGHSQIAGDTCPQCGGTMKHVGCGTQKVEQELSQLFSDVPVLRMDADTTAGGHSALLERFEKERIPILLGTQMVAKGLDFENVTLVGVLSADLSLYVDHYQAAERTFNLLTQVVGRAGRGGRDGRAVIQTYTPENDVIRCAAAQDYAGFYRQEIRLRRLRQCPPFADHFSFTLSGTDEGAVLRSSAAARDTLRQLFPDQEVLGPAPAPVLKVNNRYRYHVLLVGSNCKPTRDKISWLLKTFSNDRANRGVNIFVDCNLTD